MKTPEPCPIFQEPHGVDHSEGGDHGNEEDNHHGEDHSEAKDDSHEEDKHHGKEDNFDKKLASTEM